MARSSQIQNQRSDLKSNNWFQPSFGAFHRVEYNEELKIFFSQLEKKFDKFPKIKITDDLGVVNALRDVVHLYNPERLSLRVLERRLTDGYAKRNRFKWNKGDRVRIKAEVADQVGKYDLGGRIIPANMADVARLGDADMRLKGARVLAIIPDAESIEAGFFATEHEIAVNGISTSLKKFRTTAPYLPHISIGAIHKDATPALSNQIVQIVREALPLGVVLNPIEFISSS